jgi:hypothetical protein
MGAVILMHILNWQRMDNVTRTMRRTLGDLQETLGDDE